MPSASTTSRGIVWLLSRAACAGVLMIWLSVLAGVVVEVNQARKLAGIAQQTEQFAELPRVTRLEIVGFVSRRLEEKGLANRPFRVIWPESPAPGRTKLQIAFIR